MLILTLSACSPTSVLTGLLTGGGLNANVQAGKTNQQGINVTSQAPTVSLRPNSRVDNLDQSSGNKVENADTVNNIQGVPLIWWLYTVLIALVALWLDSPKRWPGQIYNAFKRKK